VMQKGAAAKLSAETISPSSRNGWDVLKRNISSSPLVRFVI